MKGPFGSTNPFPQHAILGNEGACERDPRSPKHGDHVLVVTRNPHPVGRG